MACDGDGDDDVIEIHIGVFMHALKLPPKLSHKPKIE